MERKEEERGYRRKGRRGKWKGRGEEAEGCEMFGTERRQVECIIPEGDKEKSSIHSLI